MPIQLVAEIAPSSDYQQNVFRVLTDPDDGWTVALLLRLPRRVDGDSKAASKKQRETLTSFFWNTDPLPLDCGWHQAGRLMDLRGLAYAVTETMEDGFLAANRIALAPLLVGYMSCSPYLLSAARGWNLGNWREGSHRSQTDWLMLIASPFYRELLEFALLARDDLCGALTNVASGIGATLKER